MGVASLLSSINRIIRIIAKTDSYNPATGTPVTMET
jgi:hypothetical protein